MTTHFQSLCPASLYTDLYGLDLPEAPLPREVVPRRLALALRAGAQGTQRDGFRAQFGFVPPQSKSISDAKLRSSKLVAARCESVATAVAFQRAWAAGQRCVVPMQAFFEDDCRSGKPVPTRISRVDGKPLLGAGLWGQWSSPEGETLLGFALISVNADQHALMRRYQHHGNEKRMPVLLNEGAMDAWLSAPLAKAGEFMRCYPAQSLTANPVEA
jgi:putative SOS response-associated peptidase YedK